MTIPNPFSEYGTLPVFPASFLSKRGEHRPCEYLRDLATIHAALADASHLHFPILDRPASRTGGLSCITVNAAVALDFANLYRDILQDITPAEIGFDILPPPKKADIAHLMTNTAMEGMLTTVHHGLFAFYSEAGLEWVKRKYSAYEKWPPIANFVRVVRNAMVHGGTINIDSKTAPAVAWHGVTYDWTKKGRKIGWDLGYGDFVILFIAFSQELDSLGAPLDLR